MKNVLFLILLDEDVNIDQYLKYLRILPVEQRTQIQNYSFDVDKKLSLFSHLLVRYFACKSLNLRNSELAFAKNSYGKPYLLGDYNFHYNISHTRNAITVGFSQAKIGVDIEKCQPIDLEIAERFFCKNELAYILSKSEGRESLFYEVWTKKEAYIKWVGKGLSMSLDTFDVTDAKIKNSLSLIKMHDYIISVCSQRKLCDKDIVILKENQFAQILIEFTEQLGDY